MSSPTCLALPCLFFCPLLSIFICLYPSLLICTPPICLTDLYLLYVSSLLPVCLFFHMAITPPVWFYSGLESPTHALRADADASAQSASATYITLAEEHLYDRHLEIILHLSGEESHLIQLHCNYTINNYITKCFCKHLQCTIYNMQLSVLRTLFGGS